MQNDRLEQFIREHREDFDREIPGLNVWAQIDQTLEQRQKQSAKRFHLWKNMRIAAAVLVLMVFSGLLGSYITQVQLSNAPESLAQVSPEYAELEQYYQQQIQDKYQQLVSYDQANAVEPDLQQLDSIMEELREELVIAPQGSEEQIIENLIQSYQTKIDILSRVLERIQTSNPKAIKKDDDEKVSI